MDGIWFLNNVNLLNILCPHKLEQHKNTHQFSLYRKNEYIYFEEEQSNKMFLIVKGKIKIGYCDASGNEFTKAILTKGEIFGENAILDGGKRREFAKAIDGGVVVCAINLETMKSLLKNNDNFSLKIYKIIGFKITKLERRLQILLYKDIKTRLVEFIKDLLVDYPPINGYDSKLTIRHPYSQSDIAALIGTSRPTVNMYFNELKNEGIISFTRKEIIIEDLDFKNITNF